MGVEDVTREEILAELDAYFTDPREPGDFAVPDVMDKFGVTRSVARARIDKMLADGAIVEVGMFDKRKYYRMVKK